MRKPLTLPDDVESLKRLVREQQSALEIARSVTANAVIAKAVDGVKDAITRGSSIAAQMRTSGEFPPLVTHMISVGEASGELPAMLEKLAATYDTQVENALQRMLVAVKF